MDFVLAGFGSMLTIVTANANSDDIIGIKIEVANDNSRPIGLHYRPVNQLSAEMILDLLNSVSQSNSLYSVTDLLIITVQIISLPNGGAIVNLSHCSDTQVLQRKARCITHIGLSNDNLCLPKAILLGKAFVDNKMNLLNRYINPASYNILNDHARSLITRANVNAIGCNMLSVYKFQKILPQYTIVVYDEKRNSGNKYVLKVNGLGGNHKIINIFYLKDLQHFVFIKSRLEFFGQSIECPICLFLHKSQNTHLCKTKCLQCRGPSVCQKIDLQSCLLCKREFKENASQAKLWYG